MIKSFLRKVFSKLWDFEDEKHLRDFARWDYFYRSRRALDRKLARTQKRSPRREYLELDFILIKNDGTEYSEQEMEDFTDDFLDWIDSKGHSCSGSYSRKSKEEL